MGRSPWLQPVAVEAPPERIGTIGRVAIDALVTHTLVGTLLDMPAGSWPAPMAHSAETAP